jgi:RNA polymerase sigma factor (sigma-70 family)
MTSQEKKHISDAFEKEHNRLLGYIRKRIPDSYEAEDILQDVFYQLTVGFRDIRTIENLKAWIYKVTGNKIIDSFRKKKPDNFSGSHLNGSSDEEVPSLADILPSGEASPDDELFRELIWEKIQEGLDEMPENQSLVFSLHEFEEKSFREISEITGETVNTLLSRKRYAVLFLRKKLESLYHLLNQ